MAKNAKKASTAKQPAMLTPSQFRPIYILQFSGPLDTPIKVQKAAGLKTIPNVLRSENEGGKYLFCKIDGFAKLAINAWLPKQNYSENFQPLFIPEHKAY